MNHSELDCLVSRLRETFNIPAVSAAFYADGQICTSDLGCEEDTLFAIGSCTKSFTAGTILALQDKGKLSVDDRIKDHLPEFRLSSPGIEDTLTIRDILSHRSGFPGCDLAWYARHDSFGEEDLQKAISLLPLSAKPGEVHQYNNMMFALSGMIIERSTGMSWKDAVKTYLLEPLGIRKAAFSFEEAEKIGLVADPYVQGKTGNIIVPHAHLGAVAPAGSMYMTAKELLKWDVTLLNRGQGKNGEVLSYSAVKELTKPNIPDPYDDTLPELAAVLKNRSYCLGFQREEFENEILLFHGGAIDGFLANQNFMPGRNCAAVLLSDLSGTLVREAFQYGFAGRILGDDRDWIKLFGQMQQPVSDSDIILQIPFKDADELMGSYEHPLFGKVIISKEDDHYSAAIGMLKMPVIFAENGPALFHPEFGILDIEIARRNGKISSLKISAEPSIKERFEFTRS